MDERIAKLLAELTVDEKAAIVTGADMWRTPAVPRLGIPQLKVSDGPVGVRGGAFGGEFTSASFPCGTALGATWSPELVLARRRGARPRGAQQGRARRCWGRP